MNINGRKICTFWRVFFFSQIQYEIMSLDIFNFLQKKQHVGINHIDDSLKMKFCFFYFLSHCLAWYSVQSVQCPVSPIISFYTENITKHIAPSIGRRHKFLALFFFGPSHLRGLVKYRFDPHLKSIKSIFRSCSSHEAV